MPALKRIIDYGYSDPPGRTGIPGVSGVSGVSGTAGIPGLTKQQIKELQRKKLLEERKKKIQKINKHEQ